MPGFDGTGPRGMGPMTGGGRGFCATPLPRTWPRYVGRTAYPTYGVPWGPMPPEQELDSLKNQAQALRGQLGQIEARIQELGKGKG
jgi:hypothetical protein